jgi:Uma2 family endonuclease
MTLTIEYLDKLQQENSNLKYELQEGEIVIMSPSDFLSEDVGGSFITHLRNWVNPRKLGRVTGSSAGFIMPNGDLLAPDVAFVKAEKLKVKKITSIIEINKKTLLWLLKKDLRL